MAFAVKQESCDDHFEKGRPCPSAVYGVSDQYLVLDSFSKLRESQIERGEFKWNFMVQGVTDSDVIGVKDKIDTVIEIQVGAFCLPILEDVAYTPTPAPYPAFPTGTNQIVLVQNNSNAANPLLPESPVLVPNVAPNGQYPPSALTTGTISRTPWVSNPLSQLPFCNRITIQLKEAGLQSYSDRDGARHHYEFNVTYLSFAAANPSMLQAIPMHGGLWDTYIFTEPLKDVHGLTLVFRNPDIPVRFQPDCLYGVVAEGDGTIAPPGNYLRFTSVGHKLNVGDRIYIIDFKSGNATLDTYVGRPDGHVASADPGEVPYPGPGESIPTPDHFWLDPVISLVDLTTPIPTLPQIVTVCIAKRRLRIPIRLRRIVERLTNYIAP